MRYSIQFGLLLIVAVGMVGSCNVDPALNKPTLTQSEEPVITAEYTFSCAPDGVTNDELISQVQDSPADGVYIRPSGDHCQFHLIYKSAGSEHQLTDSPGGHILVAGVKDSSDRTVVCTSNIDHSQIPDAFDPETGDVGRSMNAVTIRCAVNDSGTWSDMQPLIEPGGSWAAWIMSLEAIDDPEPRFELV